MLILFPKIYKHLRGKIAHVINKKYVFSKCCTHLRSWCYLLLFPKSYNKKTFIFIGGLHRSGTSILHRNIQNHPKISGMKNTGVSEDEGQHLQKVYKPAKMFGGPGSFAFNPDAYMDENHILANKQSSQKIYRQWGIWHNLTKQYLVEKSPPNLIRTRFLQKLFPNSKFIIILRHPICVSLATNGWNKKPMKELLEHWIRAHEIIFKDIVHLKSVYVFRFEDLVQNPNVYLKEIFSFIGLAMPSYIETIQNSTNEKYFELWETAQQDSSHKLHVEINPELEEKINSFGYSLTHYRKLPDVSWNDKIKATP